MRRLAALLTSTLLLAPLACSFGKRREAEAASGGPAATIPAFSVPTSHPRLYWTPERLARARERAKRQPSELRSDAPASAHALRYLLLGDRRSGEIAVKWLNGVTVRTDGVASDQARWYGEDAILVFDWCHDLLTPEQRRVLIDRWNGYIETLNKKEWGGKGLEGNNYYWGYLRNSLEWGIASSHENPKAAGFIAHALQERYAKGFVPFAAVGGRGGVFGEGTQYGPYLGGYAFIPFTTVSNFGVDLWSKSDFFREAVYYVIHATTPAPTLGGRGPGRFEIFPFNDDEKFRDGGSAEHEGLVTFMAAAAEQWRSAPVGRYAQAWLGLVNPKLPDLISLASGTPTQPLALSNLPLDYFAPGIGYLYARNRWGADGTVLHAQLGRPTRVGHEHLDWGSFQIWRRGRWLTRETTGYGDDIENWKGGTTPDGPKISSSSAIGHNTLLFEGMGPRTIGYRRGPPRVVRLQSHPDFVYAAVDLTDGYRCTRDAHKERDENEYAGRVVREIIFLRAMETLVVFDRVEASDDRKAASAVAKTFVLHTETQPLPVANGVVAVNGDQALRVWTLLPAGAKPRFVKEGGPVGQHRMEIDSRGEATSYFLHVLQGRGAKDPDLNATLQDGPDGASVTLELPGTGKARIVFEKGAASRGGKLGYARAGEPALAPLRTDVQQVRVTERGPVWQ